MNSHRATTRDLHLQELQTQLEAQGYRVVCQPERADLPEWLENYSPHLLASRGSEHLVFEVKHASEQRSLGHLSEVAQNVNSHLGWRFLLVNVDDSSECLGLTSIELPTRSVLDRRLATAKQLQNAGDNDAAFLLLWSTLEAVLRQHARDLSEPVDHLPTSAVIKHLYSQGELSYEQMETLLELGLVRTTVIHGFVEPRISERTKQLGNDIQTLMAEFLGSPREVV